MTHTITSFLSHCGCILHVWNCIFCDSSFFFFLKGAVLTLRPAGRSYKKFFFDFFFFGRARARFARPGPQPSSSWGPPAECANSSAEFGTSLIFAPGTRGISLQ